MKYFLKTTLKLLLSAILITSLTPTLDVFAQATGNTGSMSTGSNIMERMKNVAGAGGFATDGDTLPTVVGGIINAFISLLGIIFVILIVFSGFTWMTSEGNEEKIKKATATIKASIIGLIIALSAWTLWNFIFAKLIL